MTATDEATALVDRVVTRLGRLDTLVNAAGIKTHHPKGPVSHAGGAHNLWVVGPKSRSANHADLRLCPAA
ncbi:hypothetical protein ITP53_14920 [Nonomuraea sp. K274]|uniref:Uncharacterized protein n=1 Tax=Nonomuraea cypriaca TaxID=1187855 RepID=A0A931A8L2_9ACTN|nr:hypothetical protein [Nonomuraea cypriaca]